MTKLAIALAASLLLVTGAQISGQTGYDLYQKALALERAEGNLREAIRLYQRVADDAKTDRALAARALVRKANCLEKLGDADARATYEHILRDFADQQDAVKEARTRLRSVRARGDANPVTRRLWAPELDFFGRVAPNGQFTTFVDWSTGDLAVHDFRSGVDRQLAKKTSWAQSSEFAFGSVVSPDSKQIVYTWYGSPSVTTASTHSDPQTWLFSLRVIGADGREPRVLIANPEIDFLQPTAWSPDGKNIAVTLAHRDGSRRIAIVNAATGATRVVKSFDWRMPEHATFSPDGRYLLYDFPPREDSPNRDVFLLAVDGSKETTIAKHPGNDVALGWVPAASSALFSSDRTGAIDAWSVRITDGQAQGEPHLVKRAIGGIEPLGFAATGAFYYGLPTGMQDVFVASIDDAAGAIGSPSRATERSVGANRAPAWSPDGRLLAFTSGVKRTIGGGTPEFASIIIREVATGEERVIVPQIPRIYGLPRWSPDGRSLVANGYDRAGRESIHTIDVASGTTTVLVQGAVYDPAWSPDGGTLFYRAGQRAIVAYRIADGRKTEIYSGAVSGLAVSFDGQYIAFRSIEGTQAHIKLLPSSGGTPRVLADIPATSEPRFAWEADSRHLRIFGGGSTSRIDIVGGAVQPLGTDPHGIQEMAFSPDGRRVAFTAGNTRAEVWLMENFLPSSTTKR